MMSHSHSNGLEVLSRYPAASRQTDHASHLLFIHGAYTAAWCWDEYFLGWFAEQGYASHAISLSGHGASRSRDGLDRYSTDDYVNDVSEVIATLPAPPILIGHSMGGFVVQKYLECMGMACTIPAAILMCSVPPQGLMASMFNLAFRKPSLFGELNTMMTGSHVAIETLRDALFAQPITDDKLRRYLRMAQPESHRAIWDMTLFNLPHLSRIKTIPMMILGAEQDHLIPSILTAMTARSYNTKAEIFSGMGHALMLEHDWIKVAERIRIWLAEQAIK